MCSSGVGATRVAGERNVNSRRAKPSTVEVRGPPSAPEGLCPPKREFTLSLRAHQLPVTSYQPARTPVTSYQLPAKKRQGYAHRNVNSRYKIHRRGTGAPRARRTIPIDNRISDLACAIYQIPDTSYQSEPARIPVTSYQIPAMVIASD